MLFKLAHFEDVNKNASAISTNSTLPIWNISFPHCKGHKRLTPIIIVSSSEMAEMSKKSPDQQSSNMSSLTAKIFRRRNRNR